MKMNEIGNKIIAMAGHLNNMLKLIEKGFMENRVEPLSDAMKLEDEINETEKVLADNILELSKLTKDEKEKRDLSVSMQILETLERMGDEAANLIERIEIKVSENLRFSDIGVTQFNETYDAMEKSVEMMIEFLKTKNTSLKERIIDNGFHVKELVECYRKEHTDRLVKGICTPMAANMYFDMLDFTGNLARHSSNIVKLFQGSPPKPNF